MLAFPKNRGLRIDHILATAPVVERLAVADVDREERKGKQPSDHAPVFVELRD
jgi:exodeoxyribonuclease-3